MKPAGFFQWMRWLAVLLAIGLGSLACARLQPAAAPSAVPEGKVKPSQVSGKTRSAKPHKRAKSKAKKPEKAEPEKPGRLRLNPSQILTLQLQALNAQYGQEEAVIQRQNGFTRWLDNTHAKTFLWMDNAVRQVDVRWLAEDTPYNPELSTFKLKLLTRVGGPSSDKEYDIKVRFRGDLSLPGLEHRLHLYLDNAGRDSLPGTDPMKQESDPRIGVRALLKTLQNSEITAGGGVRLRGSKPVVYTGLDWRWVRQVGLMQFCFDPQVGYYSDDGFGQKIVMTWTRPVGDHKLFQVRTAERSSEAMDSVEFEQSLRFAWLRSGRGRGGGAQASVFPHLWSADWYWDDSLVNISWRDALYRRWIYYTITPQVQFPKEDEYEPRPSIRFGVEILFGGRIGELM